MRRGSLELGVAAAVVVLLVAVVAVEAAAGPPPPPTYTSIHPSGPDGGCYVSPSPVSMVLGQQLTWHNITPEEHTVEQRDGFWSFTVQADGEDEIYSRVMRSAGTYLERCDVGAYVADVLVKITGPGSPPGRSFTLRWASAGAPSSLRYDVRYKVGSSGAWRTWRNDTAQRTGTFTGTAGNTYYFQARTMRPGAGTMSEYSPSKRVVVD